MTEGEATTRGNHDRALLRIPLCLKCGYDLSGHGDGPRCPECGEQYEDGMFVLYGHKAGAINSFVFAAVFLPLSLIFLVEMIINQYFNPATIIFSLIAIVGFYCLYDGLRNIKQHRNIQKLLPYIFTHTYAGMPPTGEPSPLHHWKRVDRITLTQHPWWKKQFFKSPAKFWRLKLFWRRPHFALTAGNVDFVILATPEQANAVREQLQNFHSTALRDFIPVQS